MVVTGNGKVLGVTKAWVAEKEGVKEIVRELKKSKNCKDRMLNKLPTITKVTNNIQTKHTVKAQLEKESRPDSYFFGFSVHSSLAGLLLFSLILVFKCY